MDFLICSIERGRSVMVGATVQILILDVKLCIQSNSTVHVFLQSSECTQTEPGRLGYCGVQIHVIQEDCVQIRAL